MKPLRFRRWISRVVFALGKPAFWVWNRLSALGIALRDTEFLPQRFVCSECGRTCREVVLRTVYRGQPYDTSNRRICRRCYDDVPF